MRIGPFGSLELLVLLAVMLVPLLLFWRIFDKAGFPGAYALLVLIPGAGLFLALIVLAVAEWPLHRHGRQSSLPRSR